MNKKVRILILLGVFLLLSLALLPGSFTQEKFPSRPITFLINFPPGGAVDTCFRPLIEAASKVLGKPVVPVNKPGASGTLASASLKATKPDGYTLSVGLFNLLIVPAMEDVTFDPMKDFTYIIQVHCSTFAIAVRSDAPWKTLKDLVEYARQHPNEIKYATSSPGGVHHFAMEDIARKEGIRWKIVPYPGGAAATTALVGGHVQAVSQDSSWAPYYYSKKIRLLAVFGETRNKHLPDIPTLKELGYNPWYSPNGVIGPANMDKEVVKILHDAFREAMKDPVFVKTLDTMLIDTCYRNSESYDQLMREMNPVIKDAVRMVGLEKKK